jgi:uncharacterized protein
MSNPVNWFEIYVQDMERAKKFYETVFNVQLKKLEGTEFEMWTFPSQENGPGASGSLIRMPGFASGANSVLIYFRCADCGIEAQRAAKSGGRIETPKKSIGQYGYIAIVHDPDGNLIGLHSME